MSMGNPTDLGINRYLETTSRTTFSALLNRGIDAINTYLRDTMKAGDTGWITIGSLQNSFTAAGTAPAYRKLNGIVHLSGQLYRTSAPTTVTTVQTLPAGFRPRALVSIRGVKSWDQSVEVTPAGVIQLEATAARTTGTGYTLDGISFPAV